MRETEADILPPLKRKIKCTTREYVRTKLFAVCDITFDDVMCIPWGKRIVRYLPDTFSLE